MEKKSVHLIDSQALQRGMRGIQEILLREVVVGKAVVPMDADLRLQEQLVAKAWLLCKDHSQKAL